MDWTITYSPQQLFNTYVGVMINDYHRHPRGEGGGVVIKELHNNHAHHACNDCNGSTIYFTLTVTF